MGENSPETLGEKSKWESYIEKTKRSRVNDLHILSKLIWMNQKNTRALSLGTGSGSEVVDLIKYKWDVTCVDIEKYSEIVLKTRTKKKFEFQNVSFENIEYRGKYSYVSAYNALPFGDKKYLQEIVDKIYKHMVKGGIFVLTLFTNKHTFVKNKNSYGVTREKIGEIFKKYKIEWCEKVEYDQQRKFGVVKWSAYEIIVRKNK